MTLILNNYVYNYFEKLILMDKQIKKADLEVEIVLKDIIVLTHDIQSVVIKCNYLAQKSYQIFPL